MKLGALAFSIFFWAAACSPPATQEQTPQAEASVQTQAPEASTPTLPTATKEPATPTQEPTLSPTPTHSPTITPTPTQTLPMISVTANTHCRTGPGLTYDSVDVFQVGEIAVVLAGSTLDNFWYIAQPDNPEEPCWLSGVYANIEGDTSALLILTPAPTPTTSVGFDLYLKGFEACGSTSYVVFSVLNAGVEILKTAKVGIVELETGTQLYGPTFQRFPFAQVVRPVCPPDHGNILDPGVVAFIHVPISPVPHGENAMGTVMLCTGDYLGGDCLTKIIYFQVQ